MEHYLNNYRFIFWIASEFLDVLQVMSSWKIGTHFFIVEPSLCLSCPTVPMIGTQPKDTKIQNVIWKHCSMWINLCSYIYRIAIISVNSSNKMTLQRWAVNTHILANFSTFVCIYPFIFNPTSKKKRKFKDMVSLLVAEFIKSCHELQFCSDIPWAFYLILVRF